MTTDTRRQRITDLLHSIEAEMRRSGLWEEIAPNPQALASSAPFCYDTLQFQQWLQWVFLARMRALLDAGAPLPGACDIQPLAEHSFAELPQDTTHLVQLCGEIDRAISERN
ncbi:MAG: hypothetical protein CVV05_17065 [Gammaproteobacteria bacterium HGW-Gammaproteobacteria-1]|jgi:uncharacterized protein YqcC (DUF446 family)|nr:MAG: hypothetical protein CVV05_17065 [Gammaproteobacteria bacterium HGW-Gammaproteobacteria-1]